MFIIEPTKQIHSYNKPLVSQNLTQAKSPNNKTYLDFIISNLEQSTKIQIHGHDGAL